MAIPAFLANKFATLDFSSNVGYPNHVPLVHEWSIDFPRFTGNTNRRMNQHLKDFHEYMEQLGIVFEYVIMKLFMHSLAVDARVWYKTIPRGKISSIKNFHIKFNIFCKILYPSGALFEDCCAHFNVENISEVNDPAEDIYGAPLQEDIYFNQEASPNNQERE